MALGAEGGYDAAQMRAVALRAEVALGTIYRYFASKDHLLAATMVDWSAHEAWTIREPYSWLRFRLNGVSPDAIFFMVASQSGRLKSSLM